MSVSLDPLGFASPSESEPCLRTLDPEQVKLLDERCILVDEDDRVIGTSSKKECHLMVNIDRGESALFLSSVRLVVLSANFNISRVGFIWFQAICIVRFRCSCLIRRENS